MLFKYDDKYVTDDINNLPISELKIGDIVIVFGKGLVSKYDSWKSDAIVTMVLCKIKNRLYVFDCQATQTKVDTINEEIAAEYSHNEYYESYFLTNEGKLIEISQNKNIWGIYDDLEFQYGEAKDIEFGFMTQLYSLLFSKELDVHLQKTKIFISREYSICLPIRMSEDEYLVFRLYHSISPEINYWRTDEQVLSISRDRSVYSISCDFKRFFINLKHSYENQNLFDEFSKSIDLFEYDTKNYIMDQNRELTLENIEAEFDNEFNGELEEFFKPVYVSDTMPLKAYRDTFKGHYNHGLIFEFDGKLLNYVQKNDPQIKIQQRIAGAVYLFEHNQKFTGLSPYDGKMYKNGIIDDSAMKDDNYYIEYCGVIVGYEYKKIQKFIRLENYYVPALDDNVENKVFEEMKKNRAMVEVLLKDPV